MKKKITLLMLLATGTAVFAQNGIGIGTKTPSEAAALHIQAADKGLLIPRLAVTSLDKFFLAGFTEASKMPEGVMVYNNVAATDIPMGFYYWSTANVTTGQWELIVNQSVLDQRVDSVTEDLYNRIEELTKGQGSDPNDMSYLVTFNPNTDNTLTGFSYLKPKLDGAGKITGYEKKAIIFADLITDGEAKTFFRNAGGATGADVKAVVYFNEAAMIKNAGKTQDEIPDGDGFMIDIVGIVNNNFEEIINNNKEHIESIITKMEGNIRIVVKEEGGESIYYFSYVDEKGETVEIKIKDLETETTIAQTKVDNEGKVTTPALPQALPDAADLKKGEIYYSYKNEKGKNAVINLTNDILHSLTHNDSLRKELIKVVEKVGEGGNVYYGDVSKQGDPELNGLYTVDSEGKKTVIDLAGSIINSIDKSTTVQNKIKEISSVKLELDKDVKMNVYVDGFPVYTALRAVDIKAGSTTTVTPKTNLRFTNVQSITKIRLYKKDGSLLTDKVTDVKYNESTGGLSFDFGSGIMYQHFPVADDYVLAVEYISSVKDTQ